MSKKVFDQIAEGLQEALDVARGDAQPYNRYATEIFWSAEDEGYVAIAPDLPGCSAFGETMPEATSEIEKAITAWLQAARSAGNPVPGPIERESFGRV